jgi:hypothetical protein
MIAGHEAGMNPEPQVRRGLLARALFETLRDAGGPRAPKDAFDRDFLWEFGKLERAIQEKCTPPS